MARRKIFIFFTTVAILVTIFGSLIFIVEGPENGFTSIPKSIYWAIVTITTVGYGDLVPQTNLGKALASITMLLGYSILAVPTGIFTAELHQEMQSHKVLVKCLIALKLDMTRTLSTVNIVEASWPTRTNEWFEVKVKIEGKRAPTNRSSFYEVCRLRFFRKDNTKRTTQRLGCTPK